MLLRQTIFSAAAALLAVLSTSGQAHAQVVAGPVVNNNFGEAVLWANAATWGDAWAYRQSMTQPWHGDYYYLKTGQPTALVVPPTVRMQQNYSWGVSQNTMTPVYHQFGGGPAPASPPGVFYATPYWPSHTNQFGIYPVRAPW